MKLHTNILHQKKNLTLGKVNLASAGLALALLCPGMAQAESTGGSGATQIASLPAVITTPGTYYITQDFNINLTGSMANATSAILVNAPNVTIDLNGHTITNTNGAGNLSAGVGLQGQTNVTLKNGTIVGFTAGFYDDPSSTYASTSSGHLVQDVSFVRETATAIDSGGSNCRFVNCRALLTGGSTVNTGPVAAAFVLGKDSTIENCVVEGKTSSQPLYGIDVLGANTSVVNNRVSSVDDGIYTGPQASDKYRDNIVTNCPTAYFGSGTNIGNNN